MRHRQFVLVLLILGLICCVITPLIIFPSFGQQILITTHIVVPTPTPTPWPTPIPRTPTPIPTPQPVLTVQGPLPTLNAGAIYLLDADTGHVLDDVNGEKPAPMASTTKIMTALIAIQTADLNQLIPITQDAYDRVGYSANGTIGSTSFLRVGDSIPLKDMLYALLLPSGDDAAVAIAEALGGTQKNFVQRMNLFAYRLHMFQTHYINDDGLILDDNENKDHYTTTHDLVTLAQYAMSIPLFAQIVQTQLYGLGATAEHGAYKWITTNKLLASFDGMNGVKTGHTDAAGWCLVFAATRGNHHLVGAILNSPSENQRNQDVTTLLNWGFALPMLPPA